MSILCDVYKTHRKDALYLYVRRGEGMEKVPEALLAQFPDPELALSFILTKDRVLAKEDTALVMRDLADQGYHLQLPPSTYTAPIPVSNHDTIDADDVTHD